MARPLARGMRGAARTALAIALASTSACGLALGLDGTGSLGFGESAESGAEAAADSRATEPRDVTAPETSADATPPPDDVAVPDAPAPIDAPPPPDALDSAPADSAHADSAPADSGPTDSGGDTVGTWGFDAPSDGNADTAAPADATTAPDAATYGVFVAEMGWQSPPELGLPVMYAPTQRDDTFVIPVVCPATTRATVTITGLPGYADDANPSGCMGPPFLDLYVGHAATGTITVTVSGCSPVLFDVLEFTGNAVPGVTESPCDVEAIDALSMSIRGTSEPSDTTSLTFALVGIASSPAPTFDALWTGNSGSPSTVPAGVSANIAWLWGNPSGTDIPSWSSSASGNYASLTTVLNFP